MQISPHLAGVFASFSSSAEVADVQGKVGAEAGALQCCLALVVGDDGQLHLLQDSLVLPSVPEGVLAPAGGVTPLTYVAVVGVRETYGRDVGAVGGRRNDEMSRGNVELDSIGHFVR